MKLNTNKLALAAAATMAIWYIICASIVWVAPSGAAKLFSWMTHLLNVEGGISFPEAIYGFFEIIILAYATVYVFAWLYNRFMVAKS